MRISAKTVFLAVLALLLAACGAGTDDSTGNGDPVGQNGEAGTEDADAGDGGVIAFSFGAEHNEVYPLVAEPARVIAEERGYEFVEGAAFGDIEQQVADIESFIARGVDAIVFLPLGGIEPYEGVVEDALEAGIIVVGYFSEVPGSHATIQGDEAQGGRLLGEAAARWYEEEYQGDEGDFSWVLFTNDPLPASKQRTDAVREAMSAVTDIEPMEAHGVAAEDGVDAMGSFLASDPDVNMVLGVNDAVALGAYESLMDQIDDQGRDPSQIFVGGIDGQNEALQLLIDGGGPNGIYRASSASIIVKFGQAVANVPIDILEGGPEEGVEVEYELFTPADADRIEEVLEEYQSVVEGAED